MHCCENETFDVIKEYDPMPKNQDGSIRWFLFCWDDGKNGVRKLVRCRGCGALYLLQAYHLNKFSAHRETLFEDYYPVQDEAEADFLNASYTGIELEHRRKPTFKRP